MATPLWSHVCTFGNLNVAHPGEMQWFSERGEMVHMHADGIDVHSTVTGEHLRRYAVTTKPGATFHRRDLGLFVVEHGSVRLLDLEKGTIVAECQLPDGPVEAHCSSTFIVCFQNVGCSLVRLPDLSLVRTIGFQKRWRSAYMFEDSIVLLSASGDAMRIRYPSKR